MGPQICFVTMKLLLQKSTMPESTLKKKHVAIYYHHVQEACASGMIWTAKDDGATSLADKLTKSLPGPQ